MIESLPVNLRRLRDEKGLSQGELAERAGISRVAYRSIETGEAVPRAGTIAKIAEVLGVKTPDLMTEVRALSAVRFREKGMTSRQQLLVRVSRWLEGYCELEALLNDSRPSVFEKARLEVRGQDRKIRAKKAASAARAAANLKPTETIRDICGFLEDNGVKVFPVTLANEGFFGLCVAAADGGPAVVVNVWDRISVERWIFTAAHELGHLLLHLDAYDSQERAEDASEEKEADVFASYFLMPEEVFANEWQEARGLPLVERVLKVKRMFRVSYKTVLYRVQETTSIGPSIWGRFQAQFKARYGRTLSNREEPEGLKAGSFRSVMSEPRSADEPDRLSPHEFTQDRLSRLVRQAIEEEEITIGRAAEILDCSLAEMRGLVASWVA
jgi:Zn-dependent peptidase ImmA (M78 family)/DNA-binding XRE family transcriptional regulator